MYGLAEHCAFGQLHDELIRDCIVVGIKDTDLSKKLQLHASLDLQKAVNAVRQRETVKKQQATLRAIPSSTEGTIDAVYKKKQNSRIQLVNVSHMIKALRCTNVRVPQHFPQTKAIVHNVERLLIQDTNPQLERQFATTVQKKSTSNPCAGLNSVDNISDEENFIFLDTFSLEIVVVNGGIKPWTIGFQLNGDLIDFEIDTGADVTVIPASVYKKSRDDKLQPAGKHLCGPSLHTLTVLGKFRSTLQSANATALQDIQLCHNRATKGSVREACN